MNADITKIIDAFEAMPKTERATALAFLQSVFGAERCATRKAKKVRAGLGAKVREMRTQQGLSLQVAATRGGTTPQTLIQLERYDLATTRTLSCVAKALNVSVDSLTGRRGGVW